MCSAPFDPSGFHQSAATGLEFQPPPLHPLTSRKVPLMTEVAELVYVRLCMHECLLISSLYVANHQSNRMAGSTAS